MKGRSSDSGESTVNLGKVSYTLIKFCWTQLVLSHTRNIGQPCKGVVSVQELHIKDGTFSCVHPDVTITLQVLSAPTSSQCKSWWPGASSKGVHLHLKAEPVLCSPSTQCHKPEAALAHHTGRPWDIKDNAKGPYRAWSYNTFPWDQPCKFSYKYFYSQRLTSIICLGLNSKTVVYHKICVSFFSRCR